MCVWACVRTGYLLHYPSHWKWREENEDRVDQCWDNSRVSAYLKHCAPWSQDCRFQTSLKCELWMFKQSPVCTQQILDCRMLITVLTSWHQAPIKLQQGFSLLQGPTHRGYRQHHPSVPLRPVTWLHDRQTPSVSTDFCTTASYNCKSVVGAQQHWVQHRHCFYYYYFWLSQCFGMSSSWLYLATTYWYEVNQISSATQRRLQVKEV